VTFTILMILLVMGTKFSVLCHYWQC